MQTWSIKNIEAIDPIVQIGPTVNPIQPSIPPTWRRNSDGTIAFTVTGPAGCGALITWKFGPPVIGGVTLTKVVLSWEEMCTGNEWRDEHDVKIVLPPKVLPAVPPTPTCSNLSSQFNMSKNGSFQIDDANRKWADTGIVRGPLPINQWAAYSVEGWFDPVAKTFGVASVDFDGENHPVPSEMQGLPYQAPGPNPWDPVTVIQFQIEITQAGSGTISYRNISLLCSE